MLALRTDHSIDLDTLYIELHIRVIASCFHTDKKLAVAINIVRR